MTRCINRASILMLVMLAGLLPKVANAEMDAAHKEMYDQSKPVKERMAAIKKHTG